ncbi:MAG: MotA/TolQ/ExbB proton channel family protein [Spirochaetota bacterium]
MYLGKSIISYIPPETIPVMILILSIITLTIILERMIYFWNLKPIHIDRIREVRNALKTSDLEKAIGLLDRQGKNPTAKVVITGIEAKKMGDSSIREEMETQGYRQIHKMERFLTGLGTIATISPLMGVLGTVVGMIRSFEMGTGTKSAEVGISEALITTAMGLSVAIPAYIFYNYLVRKKEDKITEMENVTQQLLPIIESGKEA